MAKNLLYKAVLRMENALTDVKAQLIFDLINNWNQDNTYPNCQYEMIAKKISHAPAREIPIILHSILSGRGLVFEGKEYLIDTEVVNTLKELCYGKD